MRGVIVGVDGSEESGGALDWALREAADRAVPLTAVLAFESRQGPGDGPDAAAEEKRALVQEWLDAARARTGLG
ncbi:MAG: universal stress protein, partial [Cellulosimicrobium funkei]